MTDSNTSQDPEKLWMITRQLSTSPSTPQDKPKTGTQFSGNLIEEDDLSDIFTPQDDKTSVPVSKLQKNLNQFMGIIGELFMKAEQKTHSQSSQLKLDEIELSVGITGNGEVGFWGVGKVEMEGVAEVKLTFTRQKNEEHG